MIDYMSSPDPILYHSIGHSGCATMVVTIDTSSSVLHFHSPSGKQVAITYIIVTSRPDQMHGDVALLIQLK